GHVFATEIDPRLVEYAADEARRQKLTNFEAVLVSKEGVDAFYGKHRFDLVLLYDVLQFLRERVNFLSGIRKSLAPQGRLAIVRQYAAPDNFSMKDFVDWDAFVAAVKKEPLDTVIGRHLRKPLDSSADEARYRGELLWRLNRLLDTRLFLDFTSGLVFKPDVHFTPEERSYAEWTL